MDEPATDDAPAQSADKLAEVHKRALKRFDAATQPQTEIRAQALAARRFVSVPGAMWEDAWGEQFANSIRVEINKVLRGVRKIETDYRSNRIVPDFRPAGSAANGETADTLDGMHRADDYRFKSQQARDNALSEAVKGGFGAYRLTNVWDDASDPDNEQQRINPGLIIVDADQRVFFDPASTLYDKSDARFAFVLTAHTLDAFHDEHGDDAVTAWPDSATRGSFDWFRPETVLTAEYYEVEEKRETLHILTFALTGEEQRVWHKEIDADDLRDLKKQGWKVREVRRDRRRVHRYTMSGAAVLSDDGQIAGEHIPIVPVYGSREYIDGVERFKGHVHDKMDAQRLYNAKVSKLAETDALAPQERPIFAAEQMPPHLATQWANANIDRHAYALVEPLRNLDGAIVAAGPIGKVDAPTVSPVTAALLQISNTDLTEDDADGAETVKANVSEEAMNLAATRVDAKSGIYLDNMRQSVQREGEIYLSMCRDVYYEPDRVVETMTEDGDDGEAVLQQAVSTGSEYKIVNDFTRGRYKVVASVTEATATRRDKAVRSALATAEIATKAGDTELARAAIITAVSNQDGEGLDDLKKLARKLGLSIGLFEPNDDEKKAMSEAQQGQQPDPGAAVAAAQAEALQAGAKKDMAQVEKIGAEVEMTRAKTAATVAGVAIEAHRVTAPPLERGLMSPRSRA